MNTPATMKTRLSKLLNRRDLDFMAACRKVMANSGNRRLTCAYIAITAAASPAPSFYITFDYALRLLRRADSSLSSTAAARMAYIRARVDRLVASRGLSDSDALSHILAGPSPQGFYLTPQTAVRLFYRLRKSIHSNTNSYR